MTSSTTAEGSNVSIRPFQIDIPEESLQKLRRRVATPRWPDRETVDDRTQGIQLARVQHLVDYWATDYDWGNLEARMKEFPNSSRRSTGSTSISSMSARLMRTRCR